MQWDRRAFIKLAVGGVLGVHASPLMWKLMDDSTIWTQNWSWVPVPEGRCGGLRQRGQPSDRHRRQGAPGAGQGGRHPGHPGGGQPRAPLEQGRRGFRKTPRPCNFCITPTSGSPPRCCATGPPGATANSAGPRPWTSWPETWPRWPSKASPRRSWPWAKIPRAPPASFC